MKKILLFPVFLLLYCQSFCQSEIDSSRTKINKPHTVSLEATDVFLVNLSVDSIMPAWRFKVFNNTKYTLSRITVNKVYHMADTIYMTYTLLTRAKYMLFKETGVIKGRTIDVSLASTDVSGVFIMGRILKDEDINADKYYQHAALVSMGINKKRIGRFLYSQNKKSSLRL